MCDPSGAPCACPTSFPAPCATGASFNTTLMHLIGQYDGTEARAINNLRNHVTQNNYGDGLDYWRYAAALDSCASLRFAPLAHAPPPRL